MVIEEPLLSEILVTSLTDERPLSGVNPVVDVKVRFPGVGFLTNCAYERFLAYKQSNKEWVYSGLSFVVKCTCVHAHVFLQRVVIITSLFAHPAHEV